MNSSEEQKGAGAPGMGGVSSAGGTPPVHTPSTYDDGYPRDPENESPAAYSAPPVTPVVETGSRAVARRPANGGGGETPPPPSGGGGEDDEDDRVLRMSFLEHLEELRARIIRALIGVG